MAMMPMLMTMAQMIWPVATAERIIADCYTSMWEYLDYINQCNRLYGLGRLCTSVWVAFFWLFRIYFRLTADGYLSINKSSKLNYVKVKFIQYAAILGAHMDVYNAYCAQIIMNTSYLWDIRIKHSGKLPKINTWEERKCKPAKKEHGCLWKQRKPCFTMKIVSENDHKNAKRGCCSVCQPLKCSVVTWLFKWFTKIPIN